MFKTIIALSMLLIVSSLDISVSQLPNSEYTF